MKLVHNFGLIKVQNKINACNSMLMIMWVGALLPSLGALPPLPWSTNPSLGALPPPLEHYPLPWSTTPSLGALPPPLEHYPLPWSTTPSLGALPPPLEPYPLPWSTTPLPTASLFFFFQGAVIHIWTTDCRDKMYKHLAQIQQVAY